MRVLKLAMTFPVVPETLIEFAASVDELVVIEEKRPFIETQVRSLLHEARSPVPVVGKRDARGPGAGLVGGGAGRGRGGRHPRPGAARRWRPVANAVPATPRLIPLLEVPPRPPAFCSGCPHNRSTVAPVGALVGGGVGCHGIMYFEPRQAGLKKLPPTPMGAEGVPWIGLSPFVAEPHLIQNIGDGTLSHSGTLAIRASVAAGVDITFKVLYNSAVAMTGGQDVTGLMDIPSMTRALEAEGVARIVVCAEDPRRYGRRARWAPGVEVVGRDELARVQETLQQVSGVSVIVYDQRCAAEARRLRKRGLLEEPPRQVLINEAVCEGCGDCSTKSNCLSVLPLDTEFGEKRRIDNLSCNRDYTCLDGDCPSFVTLTPRPARRGRAAGDDRTPAPRRTARPPASDPRCPPARCRRRRCPWWTSSTASTSPGSGAPAWSRPTGSWPPRPRWPASSSAAWTRPGCRRRRGRWCRTCTWPPIATPWPRPPSAPVAPTCTCRGICCRRPARPIWPRCGPSPPSRWSTPASPPPRPCCRPIWPRPTPEALQQAIADAVGADRVCFIDSTRIAQDVFANPLLANVVMLGAAFQLGGLPLSVADVEAGHGPPGPHARPTTGRRSSGAGGRRTTRPRSTPGWSGAAREDRPSQAILDPSVEAQATARALVDRRPIPIGVRDLVTRRAAQAIDYQNKARAVRFLDLVERAAAVDDADHDWALTRAVAESWFKLLTYKDEYEVARLHLAVDYDRAARDLGIEGPYSVTYHLHPPILRRMGLQRKLPMGKPYAVGFRALRSLRRLRGTPLDVFGYDPDRRTERALIEEYEQLMGAQLRPASKLSYQARVELAASALAIKGYSQIKEAAVDRWRRHVAELTGAAGAATASPVQIDR